MSERGARLLALALGLAVGLCGLRWGVPTRARLEAFPERLKPTPEIAKRFADAWAEMYRGIEQTHKELRSEEPVTYVQGVESVRPGWDFPPPKLLNSYRSLLLRSENPDEQKPFVVLSRMRPWRLEFEPLWVHYGGAFIYPLGAFLEAASLLRAVHLVSGLEHYLLHPEDMGALYTAGRLFVLAFQLGSLLVLFDLGRRLSGPAAGFCAAALFALSPLAIVTTHGLKPHPYSAFWCLAAIRFAYLALESGETRSYRLGGLCAGMAAGSNFSFLPVAAVPLLAWALRAHGKRARAGELRPALEAGALAAAVFVVTNPYVIFARRDFLWETTVYTAARSRPTLAAAAALLGPHLARQLGLGAQLLALLGAGAAAASKAPGRRLLALTTLGGAAIVWAGLAFYWGFVEGPEAVRFFYPFVGLACLLAADAAFSGLLPRRLGAALVALALVDSAVRASPYLAALWRDSGPDGTRARAAAWIAANAKDGAALGLTRYPQPATTPVFRYDRYELVLFERPDALPPDRRPELLVVDDSGRVAIEASALARDYDAPQAFEPRAYAWGRIWDRSFFADAPMFVYRRKRPA